MTSKETTNDRFVYMEMAADNSEYSSMASGVGNVGGICMVLHSTSLLGLLMTQKETT